MMEAGVSLSGVDGLARDTAPEAEEAIAEYLGALGTRSNASGNTVRSYHADLASYASWCRANGVEPLSPTRRELRAYLGYLNAAGYGRATVNRHLSAIRGLFGWLVAEGRAEDDPTSTLVGMKKGKRLPRRIPAEDMRKILAVHGQAASEGRDPHDLRDQAVLELLYASGCRVSEVADLRAGDVDFARRQARVLGKGGKERVVPFHEICADSMRRYAELGRPALVRPGSPAELLFLSDTGRRYSPDLIRRMFRATLRDAGVRADYTPHDMRHTFASDLLEGGADLRSVQELLGHASPSTTQIYTHLSPDYLREVHGQAHPRG